MNIKNKKLKIAIAGLGFGKKVHLEALKESDYLTPCLLYTSPSPRDRIASRMPSSA